MTAKETRKPEQDLREKVEEGIRAWTSQHLMNTPFSQDTAAWNHLHRAKVHLSDFICKELTK